MKNGWEQRDFREGSRTPRLVGAGQHGALVWLEPGFVRWGDRLWFVRPLRDGPLDQMHGTHSEETKGIPRARGWLGATEHAEELHGFICLVETRKALKDEENKM